MVGFISTTGTSPPCHYCCFVLPLSYLPGSCCPAAPCLMLPCFVPSAAGSLLLCCGFLSGWPAISALLASLINHVCYLKPLILLLMPRRSLRRAITSCTSLPTSDPSCPVPAAFYQFEPVYVSLRGCDCQN